MARRGKQIRSYLPWAISCLSPDSFNYGLSITTTPFNPSMSFQESYASIAGGVR
jgi:hypothetical protein